MEEKNENYLLKVKLSEKEYNTLEKLSKKLYTSKSLMIRIMISQYNDKYLK